MHGFKAAICSTWLLSIIGLSCCSLANVLHAKLLHSPSIDAVSKLHLSAVESSVINLDQPISSSSGTFIIHIDSIQGASRFPLFSLQWGNEANEGYMVFSSGWWEHAVHDALYFVIDNQEQAFCYLEGQRERLNQAATLAVTWGKSDDSKGVSCEIYIDGQLVIHKNVDIQPNKKSNSIALFSDEYTDDPKAGKRQAHATPLLYFPYKMNRQEITEHSRKLPQTEKITNAPTIKNTIMFDEDIFWALSKENTDQVLSELVAAGVNRYVPCIWHGRGAYYASKTYPIEPRLHQRINSMGQDPLLYLIEQAGKFGIEVEPWITVVRREHGILPEFALNTSEHAFNIHLPEFRRYISGLITEVAEKYSIHGINLDYIRSIHTCQTDSCNRAFQSRFGYPLRMALLKSRAMPSKEDDLARWNSDAMLSLVQEISSKVKAVNPKLAISVDAHPLNKELRIQGQDSISWLNSGLIDAIYMMDYSRFLNIDKLLEAQKRIHTPSALIPLISLYELQNREVLGKTDSHLTRHISRLNRAGFFNIAFYHRKQLSEAASRLLHDMSEQQ